MTDSTRLKIQEIISSLIDNYGLVFWYDAEGDMQDFAQSLELPGVEVLTLENNAFTLKHHILKGEKPERGFVIYSPNAKPADEDNWLLDLETTAAPFSADMGSLYATECGIPLEIKKEVIDPHLEFFKLSSNRSKLKTRLRDGMNINEIARQLLAVTCKTEPTYDQLTLALAEEAFEEGTDIQEKIEKYGLSDLYWEEVKHAFGYKGSQKVKDLLIELFRDDMMRHIEKASLTNEAYIFMRDWRDSRQYGELYKQWAEKLEKELNVKKSIEGYELRQLVTMETYPCVDKVIAQYLQMEVINGTMSVERLEAVVEQRENKIFFSVAAHTIRALLEARRLIESIDQKMQGLIINSVEEGFSMYCNSLYEIDLHYRHYIHEATNAESTGLLATVTKMVQLAYTNSYLDELGKRWQPLVDGMKKWSIEHVISQRHFYNYYVSPYVDKGNKIFVIISDALRYETMIELEQRIGQMGRMVTEMKQAMLSTLPSYTQLGMAALLPNRELSYDKPADEVFADGISTKGTDNRKKILCNKKATSLAMRAEDFLAITTPKTFFKDYDVIYIYSNIIDKTGDNKDSENRVFEATEQEFDHIIKIVEMVRNGNGANILITSDHGYLYQNEQLDESDFTDFKVMGNVIADTRRFIIGTQLQPGNAVKTWNSEDVGLKQGLQIQIAKAMNRMRKQGSGSRFVHGGSMLQEVVVPLLHVNIKKTGGLSEVSVEILNQRARLTTNSQTISFYQTEPATEKVKGLTLRIGFYDPAGELISDLQTITFQSQSEDSTLREQKHTFMFKNQLSKLNGQEVLLRMEKPVANSDQWTTYKEIPYKVSVMFQAEF